MQTLEDALADAFGLHGYQTSRQAVLEGRSGDVQTVPVLAEDAQAVLVYADPEARLDLERLAAVREDLGADLVVVAGRSGGIAGVQCWDMPTLTEVLGRCALLRAGFPVPDLPLDAAPARPVEAAPTPTARSLHSGTTAADAPGAEGFGLPWGLDAVALEQSAPREEKDAGSRTSDPFPAAPHLRQAVGSFDPPAPPLSREEQVVPPAARPVPDGPPGEGLLWDIQDRHRPPLAAPPAPRADPEWDLQAAEPAPAVRRLPVMVTPRQALESAKAHMGTVDRYELLLEPVHLFDAEVDTFRDGSLDARTQDLRLQLHGTDKRIVQVDPRQVDPSGADILPGHHDIPTTERALRVGQQRALEEVRSELRRRFTRVVEVPVQDDDDLYSMTERRHVEPRDDQIRIHPLGIFHRPVWRLVGPNGAVEVDAMTGEASSVSVRSFPDAIILD